VTKRLELDRREHNGPRCPHSVVGTLWLIPLLIFVSALPPTGLPPGGHWAFPPWTPHFLDLLVFPPRLRLCTKWNPLVAKSHGSDAPHHELPPSWLYLFRQPELLAEASEGGTPILRHSTWLASPSLSFNSHAVDAVILPHCGLVGSPATCDGA